MAFIIFRLGTGSQLYLRRFYCQGRRKKDEKKKDIHIAMFVIVKLLGLGLENMDVLFCIIIVDKGP